MRPRHRRRQHHRVLRDETKKVVVGEAPSIIQKKERKGYRYKPVSPRCNPELMQHFEWFRGWVRLEVCLGLGLGLAQGLGLGLCFMLLTVPSSLSHPCFDTLH